MDQNNSQSFVNIIEVAKAQKAIMWLILLYIIVLLVPNDFYFYWLVVIVQLYFTYKLVVSLKSKYYIIWLIGMLVPVLNLILLLILNSQATKIIRRGGFKVGFMGANTKEIQSKLSQPATSVPPAVL